MVQFGLYRPLLTYGFQKIYNIEIQCEFRGPLKEVMAAQIELRDFEVVFMGASIISWHVGNFFVLVHGPHPTYLLSPGRVP